MVSVNVTLFENRIFADVVKMRSAWIRLCTYPMTGMVIRERERDLHTGSKRQR